MADKTKVFSKRDKNVDYMNQMLPVEDSFDIVQRDIQIGGKDATFYFIDGFTKDESMLKIMDSFLYQRGRYAKGRSGVRNDLHSLCGSGRDRGF